MKKSEEKPELMKGKKKEKDKKKKESKDGKKAALAKLLPAHEEDDDGWTQVGAGGLIPGDFRTSEYCQRSSPTLTKSYLF